MERNVLLIFASFCLVANGLPFYSHHHPTTSNGFDNIFRELFATHHHRSSGYNNQLPMPDGMNSMNNDFTNGMTPVLIPISNLGYPNQGYQMNNVDPMMNQGPFDNDYPRFPPQEAPFAGKSFPIVTEEDTSPPVTLHVSTTTTTTTTTIAPAITTTTIAPAITTTTDSSELPTTTKLQSSISEDSSSLDDKNKKQSFLDYDSEKKQDSAENTPKPTPNIKREADSQLNNTEPKLEKESLKVNKQTDPNPIIFPDNVDHFKQNAENNDKTSEYPKRFSDMPDILYAVNIAPSLANQYGDDSNAPRTNVVPNQSLPNTQPAPLTNRPTYNQNVQYPSSPTYVWQNPNQALTNNIAPNTVQNVIALPNQNGGTTLYTVVNLPTSGGAYVPNQMYQTNVNTGNYQTLPMNNGMQSGTPYYLLSQPNQQATQQNFQSNTPYNYSPITYTVGYVSSNGQTILVPSNSQVYQVNPQNNYVPVSNVQGNVATLTASPSNIITLPENTEAVTLLSYKDKVEDKPKKKNSNKDRISKLEEAL